MQLSGQLVDLNLRSTYSATVTIVDGKISAITKTDHAPPVYILPGFIDAHVHIESSMLTPSAFAAMAVVHGTVATISDPHEIANVLGIEGVEYMIENGHQVPFKFYFGAPSCVPATGFETSGATIDAEGVHYLLKKPEIRYLAEMMNWPGVLHADEEVMQKIAYAKALGKPVDGHAPGLTGEEAKQYIAAGISTDHESFTYDEALFKLQQGMHLLIREGSAAKNFEALIPLLADFPEKIMFCSDDKHPDDLVRGHINQLVARAVAHGHNVYDVLTAACINPIKHYRLPVGRLREGDPADCILVRDLQDFEVMATYVNGKCVAEAGRTLVHPDRPVIVNQFNTQPIDPEQLQLRATGKKIKVIEALDGQLITREKTFPATIEGELAMADPSRDILKIAVVNRYKSAPPAVAFIHGFGLKEGAIASCVGHDSHNILAVGVDDASLCRAINAIIAHKGGISAVDAKQEHVLPLPIGGIMSDQDGYTVAEAYEELDAKAKQLGSTLSAPYMTLSFMALLVIPQLKLSDKGLFDGQQFEFVPTFSD